MNKPHAKNAKVHRNLRALVSRIGRGLKRNTRRSQESLNQVTNTIKVTSEQRLEDAQHRQAILKKKVQEANATPTMKASSKQENLNAFFHTATKSFVQSQQQYESLVSILSSQPEAAKQVSEEGSEDLKGLFATLSAMLGKRSDKNSTPSQPSGSENQSQTR